MDNMHLAVPALVVRTAIVLIALLVGIRLFGKRHVGEMSVDDILLILLMANAVQNAMTGGNGHLAVALACAATLLIVGWLGGVAFYRLPSLEGRLSGRATVLINDGAPVSRNLRREHLTREHLMVAIRKQGLLKLTDVKLAVLEPNGSISIVPKEETRRG